jgi:flagellar FliJ protein
MKNFKFQLETVLTYRTALYEQALDSYMNAQDALAKSAEQLEDIIHKERAQKKDYKNEQRGFLDIGKAVVRLHYITHLHRAKKAKLDEVSARKEKAEKLKKVLVESAKDKKAMEKLKEKKTGEFFKELRDWEQKEMDESSVNKFARGASHGR